MTSSQPPSDAASLLLEVGTLLSESLEYQVALSKVARLAVPTLADWSVLDLLRSDGSLERISVHHADPEQASLTAALQLHAGGSAGGIRAASEVVETGRSEFRPYVDAEFVRRAADDPQHAALLLALGVESLLRVPIASGGRALGVLTLVYSGSGRRHSLADLKIAEELANRCAMSLENARLFAEAVRERERSQQLAERLELATRAAQIGTWDYDVTTGRLSWDARTRELFGLTLTEEVDYPKFLSRVHEDDRGWMDEQVRAVLARGVGAQFDVDYRVLVEAGAERWISARGTVISAEPLRFVGTALDVTERKLGEAAAALTGDIGIALSESLTLEAALKASCAALVQRLGVVCSAAWTLDDRGRLLQQASAGTLPRVSDESPQASVADLPYGKGIAERVAAERASVLSEPELLAEPGERLAYAGYPLLVEHRLVGVLVVYSHHRFPAVSLGAIASTAAQLAVAVDRAWLEAGSEVEFNVLAETIPQLVWTAEPNGHHDYFNRRWYEFTGLPMERALSGGWGEPFHPEDRESTLALWRASVLSGEAFQTEYRRRRADGVYRWFLGRAVAVRDTRGRIIKWFGTCTDIDEQKRIGAERELVLEQTRASEREFRAVVENVPALAWSSRADGYADFFNRQWYAYTGTTRAQAVGWCSSEVHSPDVLPLVLRRWKHSLQTGAPFEMEFPLKGADGEFRWFLSRVVPLSAADGTIERWFGTATDIEAQKRLEVERRKHMTEAERLITALERKNAELDEFAHVVSHDLKAPLRGIALLAEWIEEELVQPLPPKAHKHLSLLRQRVDRMDALINGILDYSTAGRTQAEPERIDLSQLVTEIVDLLAPDAAERVAVQPEMPWVVSQRVPLEQVLMNLVNNALKFADRAAPQVSVGAEDHGELVEISVRDNGPGIDLRHQRRIWAIFQTLGASGPGAKPADAGTGIGLAVVKKLVERVGGEAWVESAPGEGACFKFTWPKSEL